MPRDVYEGRSYFGLPTGQTVIQVLVQWVGNVLGGLVLILHFWKCLSTKFHEMFRREVRPGSSTNIKVGEPRDVPPSQKQVGNVYEGRPWQNRNTNTKIGLLAEKMFRGAGLGKIALHTHSAVQQNPSMVQTLQKNVKQMIKSESEMCMSKRFTTA